MHFIPSLLTVEKKHHILVCSPYPRDRQGSRRNAKLLILPGATDLVCTLFHLFMNTIITAGRSELSYCLSPPLSLIGFTASVPTLELISELGV